MIQVRMVDIVYFLEEGICSVVVTMETGNTVEVGITGRDGFVGLPAVLGTGHSPNRTFITIPGYGYSVKAKVLREQSEASSELRLRFKEWFKECWSRRLRRLRVIGSITSKSVWPGGC